MVLVSERVKPPTVTPGDVNLAIKQQRLATNHHTSTMHRHHHRKSRHLTFTGKVFCGVCVLLLLYVFAFVLWIWPSKSTAEIANLKQQLADCEVCSNSCLLLAGWCCGPVEANATLVLLLWWLLLC